MTSATPSGTSRKVAEQAIHWLIELQAHPGDTGRRLAWQQWCQSAPEHAVAWAQIDTMNRRLAELPRGAARPLLEPPRSPRRRRAMKALSFLGCAGLGGAALYGHGDLQRWSADYATRVGQRRRLQLADGSVVQLNTDSAIDVSLGAQQRRITLRRGEIQVQTGHDPRPMLVACSDGILQPLGTRFTVRMLSGQIRVGVEEGVVRVGNGDGNTLDLPAGRQVEFNRHLLGAPVSLAVGNNAWVDGLLSVNDMALDAFLAELARYRPGRLACDRQIAQLRISGTFPIDDSERVLAMLPRVLPVQVRQLTRYWVTVSARGS